jgi:hypothetical protein
MAENYTSGGYPVGGLERFVTGFESGYNSMLDIKKKSHELKTQLAFEEAAKNKPAKGTEGDSSTTRESPYDTGGTTGSRGSGGSGGSISSFDPSQTGDGHVAPKSERIEYYNQLAKEYGLNTQAILMTIDKEGLHNYTGDNGKSFGDFQMYTGGGMGNQALAAGINIRDPNTWKEQARFAMQQMAAHKGDAAWFASQWHGPRDHAPWAVSNFSNPDAAAPGGGRVAASGPRGLSAGSAAPVPGAPVQVGGPGSEGYGTTSPPAAAPTAPPAALSLAPVPHYGGDLQRVQAPQGLRPPAAAPLQTSALGGPGGQQPPPDIYNRPQAPPPSPSVLAQLAQQYLPQQNAALIPRDDLYGGLA